MLDLYSKIRKETASTRNHEQLNSEKNKKLRIVHHSFFSGGNNLARLGNRDVAF